MNATLRPGDLTLVTGGSGFLGSAVVRALIERGVRVRALVRASSPRDNFRGLDCEVVVGDLTDREFAEGGAEGRALPVPCRGGLSPVGARSLGDHPRQRRGHAEPQARGAGGRRRAHRLYQQRRRAARRGRHGAGRRDGGAFARRGDRRLQAQQDHGRARRRGDDPARGPARHHRQSRRRPSGHATSGRHRRAASCSTPRAAASRPSSTRG